MFGGCRGAGHLGLTAAAGRPLHDLLMLHPLAIIHSAPPPDVAYLAPFYRIAGESGVAAGSRWPDMAVSRHDLLTQANIGRMREPLGQPLLADFAAALDPVNAAVDAAPGFIWRLEPKTATRPPWTRSNGTRAGAPGVLGQHVGLGVGRGARRVRLILMPTARSSGRRQWFERMTEAYAARWDNRAATLRQRKRPRTGCGACGSPGPTVCVHAQNTPLRRTRGGGPIRSPGTRDLPGRIPERRWRSAQKPSLALRLRPR